MERVAMVARQTEIGGLGGHGGDAGFAGNGEFALSKWWT